MISLSRIGLYEHVCMFVCVCVYMHSVSYVWTIDRGLITIDDNRSLKYTGTKIEMWLLGQ